MTDDRFDQLTAYARDIEAQLPVLNQSRRLHEVGPDGIARLLELIRELEGRLGTASLALSDALEALLRGNEALPHGAIHND